MQYAIGTGKLRYQRRGQALVMVAIMWAFVLGLGGLGEPEGSYIYSPTLGDLKDAFNKVRSHVLRLTL